MTVKELKNLLSQFPDDMEVCTFSDDYDEMKYMKVKSVNKRKSKKISGNQHAFMSHEQGKIEVIVIR